MSSAVEDELFRLSLTGADRKFDFVVEIGVFIKFQKMLPYSKTQVWRVCMVTFSLSLCYVSEIEGERHECRDYCETCLEKLYEVVFELHSKLIWKGLFGDTEPVWRVSSEDHLDITKLQKHLCFQFQQ